MKTAFLTLLSFLIIFQLQAQMISLATDPASVPVSEKALNWENQKLRSDLGLEPNQFEKIKGITLERAKARALVTQMFSLEPEKQEVRIKEIESQYDAEFALVLTDKQYKKYLKLNGRTEKPEEIELVKTPEPEGPNFNERIQALISRATAPVVDPTLKPQQDSTQNKFALLADSSDIIALEGLDFKVSELNETGENAIASQPKTKVMPVAPETNTLEEPGSKMKSDTAETKPKILESEINAPENVSEINNAAPGLNLKPENVLTQP